MALSKIDGTNLIAPTIPVASGGTGTTSYTAGITEIDQWRLSADLSITTLNTLTNITANWERNDTHFAQIGTGMTESSGVFTFPQTGIYLIMFQLNCQGSNMQYMGAYAEISPDNGSSYYSRAENYDSGGQTGYFGANYCECIVDVTNASTYRAIFYVSSSGAITTEGNSNAQRTGVTFIRLGDT